jgi:hypothetical protein
MQHQTGIHKKKRLTAHSWALSIEKYAENITAVSFIGSCYTVYLQCQLICDSNYRYTLQCMESITHILLSIQWRKLNKAVEINQSLSIHRITEQYQTTVQFHLIMNKQYACDPLCDTAFCVHTIAVFTQQQHKSSQDPSDDTWRT